MEYVKNKCHTGLEAKHQKGGTKGQHLTHPIAAEYGYSVCLITYQLMLTVEMLRQNISHSVSCNALLPVFSETITEVISCTQNI